MEENWLVYLECFKNYEKIPVPTHDVTFVWNNVRLSNRQKSCLNKLFLYLEMWVAYNQFVISFVLQQCIGRFLHLYFTTLKKSRRSITRVIKFLFCFYPASRKKGPVVQLTHMSACTASLSHSLHTNPPRRAGLTVKLIMGPAVCRVAPLVTAHVLPTRHMSERVRNDLALRPMWVKWRLTPF